MYGNAVKAARPQPAPSKGGPYPVPPAGPAAQGMTAKPWPHLSGEVLQTPRGLPTWGPPCRPRRGPLCLGGGCTVFV